ncbi:hypothetical protein DFH27DRAFT_556174 [Peziza echinospora]|nr:hypothetical protein DFH27DRAFT_556174 [Peziza echinospora]
MNNTYFSSSTSPQPKTQNLRSCGILIYLTFSILKPCMLVTNLAIYLALWDFVCAYSISLTPNKPFTDQHGRHGLGQSSLDEANTCPLKSLQHLSITDFTCLCGSPAIQSSEHIDGRPSHRIGASRLFLQFSSMNLQTIMFGSPLSLLPPWSSSLHTSPSDSEEFRDNAYARKRRFKWTILLEFGSIRRSTKHSKQLKNSMWDS